MPILEIKSYFEKLATSYDYLTPSISSIVKNGSFILQPRFKQIFSINLKADGLSYDHALVGATKVHLVPYPSFDRTVYFVDLDDVGLIPVGYAIYQ